MLLSKDPKVVALGFSPTDSTGLDKAIVEIRRVLGPIDAYVVTYSRNGMNGETVVFGKKGKYSKRGHPFLSVKKIQGRLVIGFSTSDSDSRKIIQEITKQATWKQANKNGNFSLESIAINIDSFSSKMKEFAKKQDEYEDFFNKCIRGELQMPSDYTEGHSQLLRDLKEIDEDKLLAQSTRDQLIQARVGQGNFRAQVLKEWNSRCAVTKCDIKELLRASHVQPWASKSSDTESRLDPSNGLPLVSMLDALFDSGLMTFDESGQAHFTNDGSHLSVEKQLRRRGLIPEKMCLWRAPNEKLKHYLRIHHAEVFKGKLPSPNGKKISKK